VADGEQAALQEKLRAVDEQLMQLRESAASLRRSVGGNADGPAEAEDVTSAIAGAEEQETLIQELERRRGALLDRLGQT